MSPLTSGTELSSVEREPFQVFVGSSSDFTNLLWAARIRANPRSPVQLRGRKMRNVHGVMDEFGAALQLPYYFGENWDALDECLNDLEWIVPRDLILGFLDAELILADEPDLRPVLGRLLSEAVRAWRTGQNGSARVLSVVLCVATQDAAAGLADLGQFNSANITEAL
jgi:hypothetical protein